MATEDNRHLAFQSEAVGPDVLMARHLHGGEQLSDLFQYVATLYSADHDLAAEQLLGRVVTIRATLAGQAPRFFSGLACEFGHVGYAERFSLYRMVIRPFFWLLSRNRQSRVFQQKNALDIFKAIVKDEWGFADFEDRVYSQPRQRDYCVQYRESDFTFISRLLEEEGIYYFFEHTDGKHTLVLADSISAHKPVTGFETIRFQRIEQADKTKSEGVMLSWSTSKRVQAGRVALQDYDFTKPRVDLDARATDPRQHAHADAEIYDYPGYYSEILPGEDRAKVRLQEVQANYETSEGSTDASGLYPGALFKLADHPRAAENKQYLITSARYHLDSGSFQSGAGSSLQFSAEIRAIDGTVQFRPARITPPAVILGVQTATVVGQKGEDKKAPNEIWTDEYGRVKVQFHWDRVGKNDESSSCFIRVAQSWAGSKWGALYIPRIGQEVVVEFLEGNPDRPLIVGCVYNDMNRPPYKLPADATQSGIKSRSSKGATQNDYNELRFEDLKGKEEVVLHAQRNLTVQVGSDRSSSIGHDSTETVGNDAKQTVTNSLALTVDKSNYTIDVNTGNMNTKVAQSSELSAAQISGTAKTMITFQVGEACTITIDLESITLSAGESTIKLDPTGVTVTGPMVKLNS